MPDTIDAYDAWAETYDGMDNPTRDADAQLMAALAPRFAGQHLLELGCGTGKNTVVLAPHAASLLGIDVSSGMLARARARDLPATVRLEQIEPDAPWPTGDASVDVVTANLVLEHIEALGPVFAEAHRVLRPGGWLWVSELHPVRQLQGRKAHFEQDGVERSPDCFLHSFADYLGAAEGFTLREVQEPGPSERPRLLVLGFQKAQRGMLSHLSLGVRELARSSAFYDAVMAPLGQVRVWETERGVGYGPPGGDDRLALFARDGTHPAGDGFHLAFFAPDAAAVHAFHAAALAHGGTDEGAPGPRPRYGPSYYAAFVRDPDGHKLEVKVGDG